MLYKQIIKELVECLPENNEIHRQFLYRLLFLKCIGKLISVDKTKELCLKLSKSNMCFKSLYLPEFDTLEVSNEIYSRVTVFLDKFQWVCEEDLIKEIRERIEINIKKVIEINKQIKNFNQKKIKCNR